MMSDELVDPVEAGLRGEDQGLARLAALAVAAYRDGDREPLARLVASASPLLWRTVRAQGADLEQANLHRAARNGASLRNCNMKHVSETDPELARAEDFDPRAVRG